VAGHFHRKGAKENRVFTFGSSKLIEVANSVFENAAQLSGECPAT
jgi:hypothetical protein